MRERNPRVLGADELPSELQSIKDIPTFRLRKLLGPMLDTLDELLQADDLGPDLNDLLELVAAFLHGQRDTVLVLFLSAPFFLCKSP
jgi:hypothetical protein